VEESSLKDVLLTEGCIIRQSQISHSVVGIRSQIGPGTIIVDSILMGADYYDRPSRVGRLGIGANCHIEGAILDKNVQIGDGTVIKPFPRGAEIDAGNWVVQDGIVAIPKNTVIPPGTRIAPE
jgi:glucose-1-phosphate adenylyltransferase